MPSIDQGVVLYAIGSGTAATYLQGNGAAGVPRIVTSGAARASDVFYVGNAPSVSISLTANINTSGFGATVVVERQRYDAQNSGLTRWSVVGTTRTDNAILSGLVQAPVVQQTILSGHLGGRIVDTSSGALISGGALEALGVTLRTAELQGATGGARILVRACSGGFTSGDYLIASVDAG